MLFWIYLSVRRRTLHYNKATSARQLLLIMMEMYVYLLFRGTYLSCKEELNKEIILSSGPKAIPGRMAVHTERQNWYLLLRQICLEFNDSGPV